MPIFALAIFAAAFLLFQVQPLIGKFILPWFGGSPSVWSVCLLFFQVLLLAGYAYAHATTRWLPPRLQAGLHLVVLTAAVLALPIAPDETWKPVAGDDPTRHILALLFACVGLPYFALATTGPLLQRWLSGLTGSAPPYRLYALSNLGSLLALLGYPFVVEPLLSRSAQAEIWSWALGGCALLCGACALQTWRAAPEAERTWHAEVSTAGATPPTALVWALWLTLPATASVMLLATTHRMTEDVAVIPFLWVVPLALYLLSFILCFADQRWYDRSLFGVALLASLAAPRALPLLGKLSLLTDVALQALPLFIVCMVCHGELHRLRPHPRYLTAFYLTLSAGAPPCSWRCSSTTGTPARPFTVAARAWSGPAWWRLWSDWGESCSRRTAKIASCWSTPPATSTVRSTSAAARAAGRPCPPTPSSTATWCTASSSGT
jgi:hypothetical protein